MQNNNFENKKIENEKLKNEKLEIAYSYYKEKDYTNAAKIYDEIWEENHSLILEPHNYYYAWSLFYFSIKPKFKNADSSLKEFIDNIDKILSLVKQNDRSKNSDYPCLYTLTVFRMIEYLKSNQEKPEKIIFWLKKLDPKSLSSKANKSNKTDEKNKNIIYMSDKERWYLDYIKALYKSKRYEECINEASYALKNISFINDNDIWIRRYLAKSLYFKNNYNEALKLYNYILQKKKDYYLYIEFALIHYKNNNLDEAIKYYLKVFLSNEPDVKLVNAYLDVAKIFIKKNMQNESKLHAILAYSLLKDYKYNNTKVMDFINYFSIDINSIPSKKELVEQLKPIWHKLYYTYLPLLYGKVKKILGNKIAGFILGYDNKEYYFKTSEYKSKQIQLKEGLKVSFNIDDGYDKKKGKPTKVAININTIPDKDSELENK